MATHWYALHVKPHKERPVYQLLQARDKVAFLPALKVEPVNPRARKERPYLPGYLFVFLDLEQEGPNVLRWTEGAYGLVQFGGEPAIVPENLVQELRSYLEEINAAGGAVVLGPKKGDRIVIVDGAFEGYEAIFDTSLPGKNRVQVLLTYLGQQPKRVQLDADQIAKASKKAGGNGRG